MPNGINWIDALTNVQNGFATGYRVDQNGNRTGTLVSGVVPGDVRVYFYNNDDTRDPHGLNYSEAIKAGLAAMGAVEVISETNGEPIIVQMFVGFSEDMWEADFVAFLAAFRFATPAKPRHLQQWARGMLVNSEDATQHHTPALSQFNPPIEDLPQNPFVQPS